MAEQQQANSERMTVAFSNALLLTRSPENYRRWVTRTAAPSRPRQTPDEFRATIARLAGTGRLRIHD